MTLTAIPEPHTTAVSDHVATVRSFFAAWAAGDASDIDALVDARIALGPVMGLLYEQVIYCGREGVAQAFRETTARWHNFGMTVEHAEAGDDQVLAVVRLAQEKYGMRSEVRITVICELRDGRIASVTDEID
jgi:ketosteroid isomerase-like protein